MLKGLLLTALGLLLGFAVVETVLRIARPDLGQVVENPFVVPHDTRLFANKARSISLRQRPDTEVPSLVIHNCLGCRQHRDLSPVKPPGVVRIGVFGDSFTENIRMPAQYSFTEPLDYLLNRTGARFEVLNLGVDGYSTDQVCLQYMELPPETALDVVIYAYCDNDLRGNMENGLTRVGRDGLPRFVPRARRGPAFRVLKHFYATYFVLGRLDELNLRRYGNLPDDGDPSSPPFAEALERFRAILLHLKQQTAGNGQHFLVALVPRHETHNARMSALLRDWGIDVLDLHAAFRAEEPDLSGFFFENDGHWNEEGNKMAAICLFRHLAPSLGLGPADDEFVRDGLGEYYAAFGRSAVTGRWLDDTPSPTPLLQDIQDRYLGLELNLLLGPDRSPPAMEGNVAQGLQANPQMTAYVCDMADQFARIRRLPEALACYRAVAKAVPRLDDAAVRRMVQMGDEAVADHDLRAAAALYEAALALDPSLDSITALNNLAYICATDAELRSPSRAVELAERLARMGATNDYRILGTIGAAYAAAGQAVPAAEAWSNAYRKAQIAGDHGCAARIERSLEGLCR